MNLTNFINFINSAYWVYNKEVFNYLRSVIFRENSLRGASWVLVITLTLSNILGVIRDHYLAKFLPTERLDIYYAAFRLPDLIFNLLILGAIAAAVIPVMSRELKKDEEKAWRVASNMLNVGLVFLVAALIALYFLMPYILPILVHDFGQAKINETVHLARWMILSPFFFAISYFFGSLLNIKKRFLAYSLAPLFYNSAIIVATILGAQRFDVYAPVAGVIVGAALHMFIQLPPVLMLGFRPQWSLNLRDAALRRVCRLMLPRAIALGANQIQLLAFTAFASSTAGAIAIYNLSDNIQTVPTVILGNSFATAVFPRLASLYDNDKEAFHKLLLKSGRLILFLIVPAAVGLFILRAQIVRLILGYGYFGWDDTRATVDAIGFFAIGIIAQALIPLLTRAFYALEDTYYPMKATVVAVLFGTITGYWGMKNLGVSGLALGFALAGWINFFILLFGLEIKTKLKITHKFWGTIGRMLILTLLMMLVMQLTKIIIGNIVDIDTVIGLLTQTIITIIVAIVVYLGGAWLWRIPEIRM
jgi:putative peptidoglycan lipid II flippase